MKRKTPFSHWTYDKTLVSGGVGEPLHSPEVPPGLAG
jgi:hypothetical protein